MIAERSGELGARAREALANGLGSVTQDVGDLGGGHAFHADEERDLAIGGSERGERPLERELLLRVRERIERRALTACDLARRKVAGELGAHGLGADPADHQPVGDGEQVGSQERAGLETSRRLCEAEERLLEQVLGDVLPARHAQEVRVDAPAIGGERRIERGGLASAQAVDPGALVGLHASTTPDLGQRDKFSAVVETVSRVAIGRVSTRMGFMRAGGINMFFLLGFGVVIGITAIRFARNADPHRLSILRALTWAVVISSFTGFIAGLTATCRYVLENPEAAKDPLPYLLQGFSESCANLLLGGGILVITWSLVAVGVRRMPHDNL